MKVVKSMRLDQDQLNRLSRVLNYLGLGNDDTATVQTALNHLENVLQGDFLANIMDSVTLNAATFKQLQKVKKDISALKRHTN